MLTFHQKSVFRSTQEILKILLNILKMIWCDTEERDSGKMPVLIVSCSNVLNDVLEYCIVITNFFVRWLFLLFYFL